MTGCPFLCRCPACRAADPVPWWLRVAPKDELDHFHRVNKRGAIEAVRSGREWVKPPFVLGGHRIIEIVLTVAHLDHTPEHCDESNLLALCQRCHLAHDHLHHQQNAYRTRREGRAVDMFGDEACS